jgi:hypothetical protein
MYRILTGLLALSLGACADGGESLRRSIANMPPPNIQVPQQQRQVNCTSSTYGTSTVYTNCQQQ